MGMHKITHEEFISKMKIKQPNIDVLGQYMGHEIGIHCRCKICGFDHYIDSRKWEPKPKNLMYGNGCPACSGNVVLRGFNDLATTYPNIAQEWDYDINRDLFPTEITAGSHKKVGWKCNQCSHRWTAEIKSRCYGKKGCPQCAIERHTSFPEQAIYFYCKQVTPTYNRYIELGKELDVYLPELHIGIEYNGSFWHRNKEHDTKVDFFRKQGIDLIFVGDSDDNFIDSNTILHKESDLDWALNELFKLLQFDIDIDTKRDRFLIQEQYLVAKKENSFAAKYPEKAKEWDYEKNGDITPEMIDAGSHKKFWRICPECKTPYEIEIRQWAKYKCCRNCNYKICSKNLSKDVILLDVNGKQLMTFKSYEEVGKVLGINKNTVAQRCNNHKPLFGKYSGHTLWRPNELSQSLM